MEIEKLNLILTHIQDVFQNTMKELFVNECSCEETSLCFFVIEIFDCSKRVNFFDEQLRSEFIEARSKQNYDEVIQEFLKSRFENRSYVTVESERFFIGCQEIKIFWTFFSECLDRNNGSLLLKCVFEQLVKSFNESVVPLMCTNENSSIEEIVSEQSVQSHYLVQEIVQEATIKACLYLEKFYAPLNLQYIISLSGEYYEKAECRSNLIFLFQESVKKLKKADFLYRFDNIEFDGEKLEEIEFVPSKIRLIRKLLQMSQKDLCLVFGENENKKTFKVLGICRESLFDENNSEFRRIVIRFKKHMQWDMLAGRTYIFTYKNGQYKIEQHIYEQYLLHKLSACFGQQGADYKNLIKNIISSTQQEHGTMLVVMKEEDAREEAKRLGCLQYGLPESIPRQAEEINQLNSIDGSIIIDIFGKVHGIGMILDGLSLVEGNLARGARYNSAVKYSKLLKNKGICALILIVSEDGSVDIRLS